MLWGVSWAAYRKCIFGITRKTANIASLSLILNVLGAPVEKSSKQLGLRVICQVVVLRSKIRAIVTTAWIIFTAIGTRINL